MAEATALPFSPEGFTAAFPQIRPLVLDQWPEVDADALDGTEGDPDAVVVLVADATQHTKALVRKQLGELAEVAGVDASGIEARLVRLLHYLEGKAEPVAGEAKRLADTVRERGEDVGKQVAGKVHEAEDTMKDNLWMSLLAALGLGLVAGLLVGLTRGR